MKIKNHFEVLKSRKFTEKDLDGIVAECWSSHQLKMLSDKYKKIRCFDKAVDIMVESKRKLDKELDGFAEDVMAVLCDG